jgi:RHS repeat-associated protein
LRQNGINYTLDLNTGLTQVLADGTNTYLYGLGRIAERQGTTNEYYLGDALNSVRQIANDSGNITLVRNYEPYGQTAQTIGTAQTNFGFTGEFTDASGLIYLRARYYQSLTGRFTTRDTFEGDINTPVSLNRFNYARSNPVMNTDPSGHCIFAGVDTVLCAAIGGGIAGGVIGGAYAKWMYHLAYTGKCGCEGQQLISQYTEAQFVWKGIGMGAVFGAAFSALTVASAGGAVVAALAGVGLSGYGIANSVQRIQADPNNECAWWDLGLSIFGLVASGYALGKAVDKIALPGGGPASASSIFKTSEFSELTSKLPKDKPVVVIGEGMGRVNPVAEALKGKGFDVKTYEPRAIRSTPGNPSSLDLEANRSWLSYWVKDKGATVIDIGLQKGRPEPSPFYALEFRSVYQNWKYPNVLRYIVP